MSVEIIESYPNLRPFEFLRSMSYDQFRPYSLRWDNESDRKDLFSRIHKMCDEVIRAKGTITRVYNHSLATPAGMGGRLFGSTSIQFVPREIRGLLMKHTTDIDMKNAHPVILLYLCNKYKIQCPHLEYYVKHREEIIGNGADREAKKELYLKALNKDSTVPEIKEFSKEIQKIQKQIMTIPEFSNIADTVKTKKYNKSGSYSNKCICIYEDKILAVVRSYLNENNYVTRCLAFDGLMIDGNHYEKTQLLRDIETAVNTEFEGLNMVFDYKKHDNSIVVPDDFVVTDKPKDDKYLLWKEEFEQIHCKIVNRSFFIKCIKDSKGFIVEFKIFDKKSLITSYENITYDEPKENKNGTFTIVKKSCIMKWLGDESMRLYEDMNIIPPPLVCPDNVFNLWTPFYVQQLEPSATFINDDNKQDYIDKCAMIIDHIKILCNHDEDDYKFMIRWIGQLLKNPAIKTFAPTLISEEGAGKGTLIYLLQRMLGKSKVFETTDPAKYVWGNFNELMQDAFLVNCDEMDYKAQQECDGKIKGLITNNNLTINPKGVKSFRIQSYHRFIYTTNNEVPIKTHKKDRRNKIIRSSDEKIGDGEYFETLRKHIDDDVVITMLYEYFVSQDVDSFHLEVITQNKYQQTLSECAVSIPERFLEQLTRDFVGESSKEFTSEEILRKFVVWKTANEMKYECDSAKLLRNLQLLQIPNWYDKKRTRTDRFTIINFNVLRTHFNIGLDSNIAADLEEEDTDTEYVEEDN